MKYLLLLHKDRFKKNATRLFSLLAIFSLYGLAKLPEPDTDERIKLAASFSFTQYNLSALEGLSMRKIRNVNPSLERVSAWISTVGAGIAINDFDGDGLANDYCLVDPRNNQVIVAPIPGTGLRYSPILLQDKSRRTNHPTIAPMGCLPGDFNEDGRTDALVYYWGRTPLVFLRNQQHFNAVEIVNNQERWFTNAATLADVDGDGHIDIILGNYFPDGARIIDANATNKEQMQDSMSRAYNGGSTRFLLWSQGSQPVNFTLAKHGLDEDVNRGWTLAIAAADINNDLLPEIYFANDFGPDRFLYNQSTPGQLSFTLLEGEKYFTTPSSKVLGKDSFKGMGVEFADINNDGLLDIYVGNIAGEFSLEESHFAFINTGELDRLPEGYAPFIDQSEALGLSRSDWSWDVRMADFNNDGVHEAVQATGFLKGQIDRWPELHELAMGNDELLKYPASWMSTKLGDDISGHEHNPFYVKNNDGRFIDIAKELGLDLPQVTRGIAVADVDGDGDGDIDFAVANQWERSNFYQNNCPNCAAFLGLNLLLPNSPAKTDIHKGRPVIVKNSRPAIGAQAIVHLPNKKILIAQVDGGNGHSGKRSPDLHFGLGKFPAQSQLKVDISWRDPSGQTHQQNFSLQPGWHTIQLAWPNKDAKS